MAECRQMLKVDNKYELFQLVINLLGLFSFSIDVIRFGNCRHNYKGWIRKSRTFYLIIFFVNCVVASLATKGKHFIFFYVLTTRIHYLFFQIPTTAYVISRTQFPEAKNEKVKN